MKLRTKTLRHLAEMICGQSGTGGSYDWKNFGYRSSGALTRFFQDCDLEQYAHNGTTRQAWVEGVLGELNDGVASTPELPTDSMVRVLREMLAREIFLSHEAREKALGDVNGQLHRDGVTAYLDQFGNVQFRQQDGVVDTALTVVSLSVPTWSAEERRRRDQVSSYLLSASEDDFTQSFLVPLFSLMCFQRITVAGHRDKALEYGKDLWMKYQLPTRHSLYFGVQVKAGTIDAAGRAQAGRANVAELLNQVTMMIEHPILDPEVNRKVLVDHVFIVSTGEITKQARNWLGERLDQSKRRQLIFLDRDELVSLAIERNFEAWTPPTK